MTRKVEVLKESEINLNAEAARARNKQWEAEQAADPTNATRAGRIAELRSDIARYKRKRPQHVP